MSLLDSLPQFLSGGGGSSGGSSGGSGGSTNIIVQGDSSVNVLDSATQNNHGELNFITDANTVMKIKGNKIGILTDTPQRTVEINDPDGRCLRLSYNDNKGYSLAYTDIFVKYDGSLAITPLSGNTYLPFNTPTSGLYFGNVQLTASAMQLNMLDIIGTGIAQANKALVLDQNGSIATINNLTTTTLNSTNINGQIMTATQPNITGLGNLTNLNIQNDLFLGDPSKSLLKIYTNESIDQYIHLDTVYNSLSNSMILNNNLFINSSNIGLNTKSPFAKMEIVNDYTQQQNNQTIIPHLRFKNQNKISDFTLDPNGNLLINSLTSNIGYSYNSNIISYPLEISNNNINDTVQGMGVGLKFKMNEMTFGTFSIQNDTINTRNGLLSIGLLNNNSLINNILTLTSNSILTVCELYEYSDKRLKKNIKTVKTESLLDKILKVKIKSYEYITDASNTSKIGIIAQDIKKIIPNIVNISSRDNIKDFHTVKANELIYYLIGCVQELHKRLEKIENKI